MILLLAFLLLPCLCERTPVKVTRYGLAETPQGTKVVEIREPSGPSPASRRRNIVVEEPPPRRDREREHRPREPDRPRLKEYKPERRRVVEERSDFLIVFHGMEKTIELIIPGITKRSTVGKLRDELIRSTRSYLVESDAFQAEVRKGERPYFYPEYVKYNELKHTRLKDIKFFKNPPHFHANIYPLVVHKAGKEDNVAIFRFPEYRTVGALKKSLVLSRNIEKNDTLHALVAKRGGGSHIMELQDTSRLHRIPFKDGLHQYYVNYYRVVLRYVGTRKRPRRIDLAGVNKYSTTIGELRNKLIGRTFVRSPNVLMAVIWDSRTKLYVNTMISTIATEKLYNIQFRDMPPDIYVYKSEKDNEVLKATRKKDDVPRSTRGKPVQKRTASKCYLCNNQKCYYDSGRGSSIDRVFSIAGKLHYGSEGALFGGDALLAGNECSACGGKGIEARNTAPLDRWSLARGDCATVKPPRSRPPRPQPTKVQPVSKAQPYAKPASTARPEKPGPHPPGPCCPAHKIGSLTLTIITISKTKEVITVLRDCTISKLKGLLRRKKGGLFPEGAKLIAICVVKGETREKDLTRSTDLVLMEYQENMCKGNVPQFRVEKAEPDLTDGIRVVGTSGPSDDGIRVVATSDPLDGIRIVGTPDPSDGIRVVGTSYKEDSRTTRVKSTYGARGPSDDGIRVSPSDDGIRVGTSYSRKTNVELTYGKTYREDDSDKSGDSSGDDSGDTHISIERKSTMSSYPNLYKEAAVLPTVSENEPSIISQRSRTSYSGFNINSARETPGSVISERPGPEPKIYTIAEDHPNVASGTSHRQSSYSGFNRNTAIEDPRSVIPERTRTAYPAPHVSTAKENPRSIISERPRTTYPEPHRSTAKENPRSIHPDIRDVEPSVTRPRTVNTSSRSEASLREPGTLKHRSTEPLSAKPNTVLRDPSTVRPGTVKELGTESPSTVKESKTEKPSTLKPSTVKESKTEKPITLRPSTVRPGTVKGPSTARPNTREPTLNTRSSKVNPSTAATSIYSAVGSERTGSRAGGNVGDDGGDDIPHAKKGDIEWTQIGEAGDPTASEPTRVKFPNFGWVVVDSVLGQGTFGRVWSVTPEDEDLMYAGEYAMKLTSADKKKNACYIDTIRATAKSEIKIHRSLGQHPRVIKFYSAMMDESTGEQPDGAYHYFLLMEKAEMSFHDFFTMLSGRGRNLEPEEHDFYALEQMEVAEVLHDHGIVHKDIKEGNFFWMGKKDGENEGGKLKIGDFGAAARLVGDQKFKDYVGTPHYMSPYALVNGPDYKQFRTKMNRYYGRDTDRWAIGVVMFRRSYDMWPYTEESDAMVGNYNELIKVQVTRILQLFSDGTEIDEQRLLPEEADMIEGGEISKGLKNLLMSWLTPRVLEYSIPEALNSDWAKKVKEHWRKKGRAPWILEKKEFNGLEAEFYTSTTGDNWEKRDEDDDDDDDNYYDDEDYED